MKTGVPQNTQAQSMEISDTHAKFTDQKATIEELMTVESALLNTFESECRAALGPQFMKLGAKVKALLRNVNDIKRLIYTLLNSDCVTFYS